MASKLKSMNQDIIWVALLGLVLGVLARSCVEGLQKSMEEENIKYAVVRLEELRMVVKVEIFTGIVSGASDHVYVVLGSIYSIDLIHAG
ncbi:hypothetical protein GOBAR_AA17154 [Gossypium barbadense]|uniref:CNNM transmembrane domain-containing protein n=1 Tax=Gossypium barbadense TaxID=3634 RepID=A0A2P5XJQ1_GOSBA|nr:hypothetical protein GOBAR_AA17154 [Gossypium barbadense]